MVIESVLLPVARPLGNQIRPGLYELKLRIWVLVEKGEQPVQLEQSAAVVGVRPDVDISENVGSFPWWKVAILKPLILLEKLSRFSVEWLPSALH